jgi:hypothetical protein
MVMKMKKNLWLETLKALFQAIVLKMIDMNWSTSFEALVNQKIGADILFIV